MQTILQRPESELIRKVYEAMKADPVPDDWCLMVKNDFEEINLEISDQEIINMDTKSYKTLIKSRVRDYSYIELKELQAGHEKGNKMDHEDLQKPQEYLQTNKLTNKQASLLFHLRGQSINGIRDSFHKQYNRDLQCRLCMSKIDSQSRLI